MKKLLEQIEANKKKMNEKIDKVPKVHWEILRYSNNHSKDEVLAKYPDYKIFINTINFNQ